MNKLAASGLAFLALLAFLLFRLELPSIARGAGYVSTVSPPIKVHSPAEAIAIKVNVKNGQLLEIHDTLIVASVERPQGIAFVETPASAKFCEIAYFNCALRRREHETLVPYKVRQ